MIKTIYFASTKIWQTLLKTIVYGVCINLQTDFVGVVSSFARMYTSRLKVKQRAKIVNSRWAGSFGELLVCFAAKPSLISWSSDYSILIEKSSGWSNTGMT